MVTGRAEGTGLGLTIAQSIINRHGGLLECESQTRATPALPSLPTNGTDIMHRQAKVWVVDDDSSIRWVLERALNQAGIDNESFEDGDQLLQRINTEQPDVIISDIRMPGTDGLELLSLLSEKYPDLPIIITTAHSGPG